MIHTTKNQVSLVIAPCLLLHTSYTPLYAHHDGQIHRNNKDIGRTLRFEGPKPWWSKAHHLKTIPGTHGWPCVNTTDCEKQRWPEISTLSSDVQCLHFVTCSTGTHNCSMRVSEAQAISKSPANPRCGTSQFYKSSIGRLFYIPLVYSPCVVSSFEQQNAYS